MIDEAVIHIKAGRGGDGAVTFRHEKYVDKGGPDGGDGGDGGNIIFICRTNEDTLTRYKREKEFSAENGAPGTKNNRHGKNGEDLVLAVALGTIITDTDSNKILADLTQDGQKITIAKGGVGGLGNVHFATATHRVPREMKPGEPGEELNLKLELKLIADVGLVGLPNAGKSTLISVISNAKPKIADYPFTTLEPNLGVVNYGSKNFIVCDVPGLIKGASGGKGLGDRFLRHIERTKIIVHLVDATSDNLKSDYKTIRKELENFSPNLANKKEIVVLSKVDLIDKLPKNFKYDLVISAVTHKNIDKLLQEIVNSLS